jgi:hypothetical protein
MQFCFVTAVPMYFNFTVFPKGLLAVELNYDFLRYFVPYSRIYFKDNGSGSTPALPLKSVDANDSPWVFSIYM